MEVSGLGYTTFKNTSLDSRKEIPNMVRSQLKKEHHPE